MVKVQPAAGLVLDDALGTQNDAIGFLAVQCGENAAQLVGGELLRRFNAPALENLIGIMPMMVMMVFMRMSMFFMLIMVMMMAAAPMIVVVIVIMVVVMMVMFVFVMIVVIIMMVVMAAAIVVIVIIVILMGSLDHLGQLLREGILVVHGLENLLAGELIPWSGDDNGVLIVLTQQSNGGCELFLTDRAGAAENDAGRSFDLVAVKFPEVFQVNLALCGVCDGDEAAEADIRSRNALHRTDHVAELAYAGRFDENAVWLIICDDLRQRTAEVTNE